MTAVTLRQWFIALICLAGISAVQAREVLYVRLGGSEGVKVIAETLVDRVARDPLTGPSFQGANLNRIKRLLAEQICELSGGSCRYSGDSMKQVHEGHHITQAQFYRVVATLRDVLRERHVDQRSTNELLRLLAPTKRDVVEPPEGKGGPARLPPAATESSNAGPT
ncbi:MAG: group 1 truncated hemoglobin [Steroidobacteraceae bacterium]|jgi:hemoglobin